MSDEVPGPSLPLSASAVASFLRAALEAAAGHAPAGTLVTFRQRAHPVLEQADAEVLPVLRELGVRYLCGRSPTSGDVWLTLVCDERIGPARQRIELTTETQRHGVGKRIKTRRIRASVVNPTGEHE